MGTTGLTAIVNIKKNGNSGQHIMAVMLMNGKTIDGDQ